MRPSPTQPSPKLTCCHWTDSGALSAWLRLKYPNTIYAAVSTSSPIVAVENFKEYQQVCCSTRCLCLPSLAIVIHRHILEQGGMTKRRLTHHRAEIKVVQNSLETATNGAACVDRIREATGRFEQFTTTAAGLMGLATMFNTCKPIAMTKNEIANLMSTLAGAFDGVVQCVFPVVDSVSTHVLTVPSTPEKVQQGQPRIRTPRVPRTPGS